ncbi:MAG: ecotin family protein, partial [Verrucomicrobiota bacterium]|nr:ecotin family protein [Verrucomicrobiota bacterium]
MNRYLSISVDFFSSLDVWGDAHHRELKHFPEDQHGQVRHVIVLPEKTREEEVNFQVELIPGKVMETDG